MIATSREPLQLPGERVVPVPPLELPAVGDEQPISRLLQNEAVMLFSERAAAASGSFDLSASNRSAVVGLCRRLDGLPLAIELAAVRMRVLTVEQILDRLTDRFALLTGGGRAALPRQQTLRTTIDWSHDLLTAAEQRLLRRLCVFAGRFAVDDVEPVLAIDRGSGAQALDLLAALVDKSLVMREDAFGVACYRLHETMREYASLKLREAGEVEPARRRLRRVLPNAVSRSSGGPASRHPSRRPLSGAWGATGRLSGSSGLTSRSTTSDRHSRSAWLLRTGGVVSSSPHRSGTTGSRAGPRRASAGSMTCSRPLRDPRTFRRGRTTSGDG